MLSASVVPMPAARVISLNRGRATDLLIGGRPGRTAIDKRPVAGPVPVGLLGLDDDERDFLGERAGRFPAFG